MSNNTNRWLMITVGVILGVLLIISMINLFVPKKDNTPGEGKNSENNTSAGDGPVDQNKVFNNFTSTDIYKHVVQVTPSLERGANKSTKSFAIVEMQEVSGGWVVVIIKPYVNPDNVHLSTVLRDNGKALITKLDPFPVRLGEYYASENEIELPKEVIDILIKNSKRDFNEE